MGTGRADCTYREEGDLVTRYLTGQLPEEEADAFAAHYFECEPCWREIQRAVEVRAAFESIPEPAGASRGSGVWRRRWPLAAAAAAMLLAAGFLFVLLRDAAGPDPGFRSTGATFEVSVHVEGRAFHAAWPPVAAADVYQVRVFAGDGTLVLEQELADTAFVLTAAEVPDGVADGVLFLEVQALDVLRQALARSAVREIGIPADAR